MFQKGANLVVSRYNYPVQLSIVLRYVYKGAIHERFVGFTHAQELNAQALTEYIVGVLDHLQLDIRDCISQCYDGASVAVALV